MLERRRNRTFRRVISAASGLMLGLVGLPTSALADYLLRPGDVVAITIYGARDITHQSRVDVDGMVALPFVGRLQASGKSLDEVRAAVFDVLGAEPFRQVGETGQEVELYLRLSEVLVEIAEFGPVFASGVVTTPGEVPYTPGMTVRQLVAQAGGLRMAQVDQAEVMQLRSGLVAEQALASRRVETRMIQVRRLQEQLDLIGATDIAPEMSEAGAELSSGSAPAAETSALVPQMEQPDSPPERPDTLDADVVALGAGEADDPATVAVAAVTDSPTERPVQAAVPEDGGSDDRPTDLEEVGRLLTEASGETRSSQSAIAQTLLEDMDLRLDILRDRQAEEAALVEIDQMEIDRVSDLRERGLLPASAELSALRALRVSNAQSLDTTSEIVEIEIEAARMAAEVAEQGAEQRLDLLTELEARLAEVALDRAQLDTIAAQLSAFDTMLEVAEESTTYVLHRGVGDDAVQREVGPDEPLLPGDVVEVIAGRVGASETTSP